MKTSSPAMPEFLGGPIDGKVDASININPGDTLYDPINFSVYQFDGENYIFKGWKVKNKIISYHGWPNV